MSDFTIDNIPFGVISYDKKTVCATAYLDSAIDLSLLSHIGVFSHIPQLDISVFDKPSLNAFMNLGKGVWSLVRKTLQALLPNPTPEQKQAFVSLSSVKMKLPCQIGDYTDFYASKEHATNVGTMFRGAANALPANYLHLPIGYHGRASSVVISGTPITRPSGLIIKKDEKGEQEILFGKCKKLDFELEIGFVTGQGNVLGTNIDISDTKSQIFGLVLLNDWSARDIQQFEYVPLGPFLGKNFGTSISPWIITLEALEPFTAPSPVQVPSPVSYLQPTPSVNHNYDINLSVSVNNTIVTKSNLKYMYWSIFQQLAHHTINGCNMNTGDICGTGTISGPLEGEYGSMLELSWNGTRSVETTKGKRMFLEDGDDVVMRGFCEKDGKRIGFGECSGAVMG